MQSPSIIYQQFYTQKKRSAWIDSHALLSICSHQIIQQ